MQWRHPARSQQSRPARSYAAEKHNPLFLYHRVRVSEESYLEISAGLTAGFRSLGPASKRMLGNQLWATSTRLHASRSALDLPAADDE